MSVSDRMIVSLAGMTEAVVEGVRRIMGRYPRSTGLILVSLLVGLVLLILSGSIGLIVLFSFEVSPEAAKLMLYLCIGCWLSATLPLVLLIDRKAMTSGTHRRLIDKAQTGNRKSMWRMVDSYMYGGHGMMKNPSEANWWLRALAASGDADAAFCLYEHHAKGIGTIRSSANARSWLEVAAGMGHAEAIRIVNG